jgi:hypothetical protein
MQLCKSARFCTYVLNTTILLLYIDSTASLVCEGHANIATGILCKGQGSHQLLRKVGHTGWLTTCYAWLPWDGSHEKYCIDGRTVGLASVGGISGQVLERDGSGPLNIMVALARGSCTLFADCSSEVVDRSCAESVITLHYTIMERSLVVH